MKKYLLLSTYLLLFLSVQAQGKGDKTIIVNGVGFLQVCNALLDSGYVLDRKDNELQTAKTEYKMYERGWNAAYSISVRVKDSVAYISGTFNAPGMTGGLFKDDPVTAQINKKGELIWKSLGGYPFLRLKQFAESFNKDLRYQ